MRIILVIGYEIISSLIFSFPRIRPFNILKSSFLRILNAKVGHHVVYYPGIKLGYPNKLTLGDNVDLAWGVIITTGGGVEIGDRTLVGYGTKILSTNHIIPQGAGRVFGSGHERKYVKIGSDCWLGANVVVLPGVDIGKGSIVAAGAVVTKNVPEYSIVAGIPATIIKHR